MLPTRSPLGAARALITPARIHKGHTDNGRSLHWKLDAKYLTMLKPILQELLFSSYLGSFFFQAAAALINMILSVCVEIWGCGIAWTGAGLFYGAKWRLIFRDVSQGCTAQERRGEKELGLIYSCITLLASLCKCLELKYQQSSRIKQTLRVRRRDPV